NRRQRLRYGPELIGTVIDERYKITAHIGVGGMGAVYQAEHLSLERNVALKFLLKCQLDEKELARFKREALALNALKHRNIPLFYEFGQWQDSPYIVTELIRGESLDEVLSAQGRLTADQTRQIAVQLAEALRCAHKYGVIHRDVKPSN